MLPLSHSPDGERLIHCSQEPVCPTNSASQWGGQNSGVLFVPWGALSSKIQAYMPIEEVQDCLHIELKDYISKNHILLNQVTFTPAIAVVDL